MLCSEEVAEKVLCATKLGGLVSELLLMSICVFGLQ